MPPCGNFSHDLLSLLGRSTFDGMKVVRCTIVALDPKNNTVDVELGEDPPTALYAGELRDTDCSSIPSFAGDGWSADEERRRFNDVPIFYHCQGSTGTVNELRTGHMAFRVPPIELTTPPFSAGTVAENHAAIIREKVYMVYIPPTVAEAAGGSLGHRYVVGHSDRNDIAPCRTEYICLRIHTPFNVDTEADSFGHSDATKTIVAIVDPVGRRLYKGLEPYGITFPCTAQAIIDRVQAITLDEDTPQIDIDFLDTLHAITPLYQNAFVFQAPFWYEPYSTSVTYYFDPYGHQYYPSRLHWLTHFFDYCLQCQDFEDKRLLSEPYAACHIYTTMSGEMDGSAPGISIPDVPIGPFPIRQMVRTRSYELLSGGAYRASIDIEIDEDLSYAGSSEVSAIYGEQYTCSTSQCRDVEVTFENWLYTPDLHFMDSGFYQWWGPWHPQKGYVTISGTTNYTMVTGGLYGNAAMNYVYEYTVKVYSPFQITEEITEMSPWYEFEHDEAAVFIQSSNDAITIGRIGSYAVSSFIHGGAGNFTSKAMFAYNSSSYYGATSLSHVMYFRPIPSASEYLTNLLGQMMTMHEATGLGSYEGESYVGDSFVSAFVIDVLEE